MWPAGGTAAVAAGFVHARRAATRHDSIGSRGTIRGVKRRLVNLLAALSLVAFMATTMLWVRSYWAADSIGWDGAGHTLGVESQKGRVMVGTTAEPAAAGDETGFHRHFGLTPEQFTFDDLFGEQGGLDSVTRTLRPRESRCFRYGSPASCLLYCLACG
jgi:hypothetical protein